MERNWQQRIPVTCSGGKRDSSYLLSCKLFIEKNENKNTNSNCLSL